MIIRFLIINNSIIYYFKIISYKFIYKFSRTILIFLTIIVSLTRSIKRYILRKYISLLICSIINSIFTNLLSYIGLKKPTLLKFHRKLLFSFVIVIDLGNFDILKISKILNRPRYNKFLTIY